MGRLSEFHHQKELFMHAPTVFHPCSFSGARFGLSAGCVLGGGGFLDCSGTCRVESDSLEFMMTGMLVCSVSS